MRFTSHWSFYSSRRLTRLRLGTTSVVILGFILLAGCLDPKYPQNPKDLFADGKLPLAVELEVNPRPTPAAVQKVTELIASGETLRVGVMDTGIDYRHPSLENQTLYRVQDGEVLGIGKDVLGGDEFAHPNIFDSRLFAFGAQDINAAGQIVGAHPDPLVLYTELNKKFINELKRLMRVSPKLQASLFYQKITSYHQLSLWGARRLLAERDALLTAYAENLEKNQLLIRNLAVDRQENDADYKKAVFTKELMWTMEQSSGLPRSLPTNDSDELLTNLAAIEDFPDFLAAVEQSYALVAETTPIELYWQNLESFAELRSLTNDQVKSLSKETTAGEKACEFLNKRWFQYMTDYALIDPWGQLLMASLDELPADQLVQLYQPDTAVETVRSTIESHLTAQLDLARRTYQEKLNSNRRLTLRTERRYHSALRLSEEAIRKLRQEIGLRSTDELRQPLQIPAARNREYSQYLKFSAQKYLSALGANASHGTHVAAVIAAKNPKVLIDPIRVNTSPSSYSAQGRNQITDSFFRGLAKWLNHHPSMLNRIMADYGSLVSGSKKLNLRNPKHQQKVLSNIQRLAQDWVQDEYADPRAQAELMLNIDFINQVTAAIRYAGSQQLKLVNVSLGTDNSRGLTHPDENFRDDPVRMQNELFRFLSFEYFKHVLALNIKTYAPHTVFFVAAGNDGMWYDSLSKDVVPAGLSSSYLIARDAERAFTEVASTDTDVRDNIVVVASLGEDGSLSPFTNLPLLTSTHLVFAKGENVLSAIGLSDFSGATSQYKMLWQPDDLTIKLNPASELDQKLLETLQPGANYLDTATQLIDAISLLEELSTGPLLKDFCLNSRICTANMSGTSMATPNAMSLVADRLQKLAQQKQIKDGSELYAHPDFSPAAIQNLIRRFAPTMASLQVYDTETKTVFSAPHVYSSHPVLFADGTAPVVPLRPTYESLCRDLINPKN